MPLGHRRWASAPACPLTPRPLVLASVMQSESVGAAWAAAISTCRSGLERRLSPRVAAMVTIITEVDFNLDVTVLIFVKPLRLIQTVA
jgi:hypothetical protein